MSMVSGVSVLVSAFGSLASRFDSTELVAGWLLASSQWSATIDSSPTSQP
jgi:hypothetical protein